MFEGLIEQLLNKLVGDYLEDINRDTLKLSLWGGDITLNNVRVKRSLFLQLKLPVDVIDASVDKLTISVPWHRITSEAVSVRISGVRVLCREHADSSDVRAMIDRVQRKVKQAQNGEVGALFAVVGDADDEVAEGLSETKVSWAERHVWALRVQYLHMALTSLLTFAGEVKRVEDQHARGEDASDGAPGWGAWLGGLMGAGVAADAGANADALAGTAGGASSGESFSERLLGTLASNAEILVEDVHVRYEHGDTQGDISNAGSASNRPAETRHGERRERLARECVRDAAFAFGVRVSQVHVRGVSEDAHVRAEEDGTVVRKRVNVQGLNVYLNGDAPTAHAGAPTPVYNHAVSAPSAPLSSNSNAARAADDATSHARSALAAYNQRRRQRPAPAPPAPAYPREVLPASPSLYTHDGVVALHPSEAPAIASTYARTPPTPLVYSLFPPAPSVAALALRTTARQPPPLHWHALPSAHRHWLLAAAPAPARTETDAATPARATDRNTAGAAEQVTVAAAFARTDAHGLFSVSYVADEFSRTTHATAPERDGTCSPRARTPSRTRHALERAERGAVNNISAGEVVGADTPSSREYGNVFDSAQADAATTRTHVRGDISGMGSDAVGAGASAQAVYLPPHYQWLLHPTDIAADVTIRPRTGKAPQRLTSRSLPSSTATSALASPEALGAVPDVPPLALARLRVSHVRVTVTDVQLAHAAGMIALLTRLQHAVAHAAHLGELPPMPRADKDRHDIARAAAQEAGLPTPSARAWVRSAWRHAAMCARLLRHSAPVGTSGTHAHAHAASNALSLSVNAPSYPVKPLTAFPSLATRPLTPALSLPGLLPVPLAASRRTLRERYSALFARSHRLCPPWLSPLSPLARGELRALERSLSARDLLLGQLLAAGTVARQRQFAHFVHKQLLRKQGTEGGLFSLGFFTAAVIGDADADAAAISSLGDESAPPLHLLPAAGAAADDFGPLADAVYSAVREALPSLGVSPAQRAWLHRLDDVFHRAHAGVIRGIAVRRSGPECVLTTRDDDAVLPCSTTARLPLPRARDPTSHAPLSPQCATPVASSPLSLLRALHADVWVERVSVSMLTVRYAAVTRDISSLAAPAPASTDREAPSADSAAQPYPRVILFPSRTLARAHAVPQFPHVFAVAEPMLSLSLSIAAAADVVLPAAPLPGEPPAISVDAAVLQLSLHDDRAAFHTRLAHTNLYRFLKAHDFVRFLAAKAARDAIASTEDLGARGLLLPRVGEWSWRELCVVGDDPVAPEQDTVQGDAAEGRTRAPAGGDEHAWLRRNLFADPASPLCGRAAPALLPPALLPAANVLASLVTRPALLGGAAHTDTQVRAVVLPLAILVNADTLATALTLAPALISALAPLSALAAGADAALPAAPSPTSFAQLLARTRALAPPQPVPAPRVCVRAAVLGLAVTVPRIVSATAAPLALTPSALPRGTSSSSPRAPVPPHRSSPLSLTSSFLLVELPAVKMLLIPSYTPRTRPAPFTDGLSLFHPAALPTRPSPSTVPADPATAATAPAPLTAAAPVLSVRVYGLHAALALVNPSHTVAPFAASRAHAHTTVSADTFAAPSPLAALATVTSLSYVPRGVRATHHGALTEFMPAQACSCGHQVHAPTCASTLRISVTAAASLPSAADLSPAQPSLDRLTVTTTSTTASAPAEAFPAPSPALVAAPSPLAPARAPAGLLLGPVFSLLDAGAADALALSPAQRGVLLKASVALPAPVLMRGRTRSRASSAVSSPVASPATTTVTALCADVAGESPAVVQVLVGALHVRLCPVVVAVVVDTVARLTDSLLPAVAALQTALQPPCTAPPLVSLTHSGDVVADAAVTVLPAAAEVHVQPCDDRAAIADTSVPAAPTPVPSTSEDSSRPVPVSLGRLAALDCPAFAFTPVLMLPRWAADAHDMSSSVASRAMPWMRPRRTRVVAEVSALLCSVRVSVYSLTALAANGRGNAVLSHNSRTPLWDATFATVALAAPSSSASGSPPAAAVSLLNHFYSYYSYADLALSVRHALTARLAVPDLDLVVERITTRVTAAEAVVLQCVRMPIDAFADSKAAAQAARGGGVREPSRPSAASTARTPRGWHSLPLARALTRAAYIHTDTGLTAPLAQPSGVLAPPQVCSSLGPAPVAPFVSSLTALTLVSGCVVRPSVTVAAAVGALRLVDNLCVPSDADVEGELAQSDADVHGGAVAQPAAPDAIAAQPAPSPQPTPHETTLRLPAALALPAPDYYRHVPSHKCFLAILPHTTQLIEQPTGEPTVDSTFDQSPFLRLLRGVLPALPMDDGDVLSSASFPFPYTTPAVSVTVAASPARPTITYAALALDDTATAAPRAPAVPTDSVADAVPLPASLAGAVVADAVLATAAAPTQRFYPHLHAPPTFALAVADPTLPLADAPAPAPDSVPPPSSAATALSPLSLLADAPVSLARSTEHYPPSHPAHPARALAPAHAPASLSVAAAAAPTAAISASLGVLTVNFNPLTLSLLLALTAPPLLHDQPPAWAEATRAADATGAQSAAPDHARGGAPVPSPNTPTALSSPASPAAADPLSEPLLASPAELILSVPYRALSAAFLAYVDPRPLMPPSPSAPPAPTPSTRAAARATAAMPRPFRTTAAVRVSASISSLTLHLNETPKVHSMPMRIRGRLPAGPGVAALHQARERAADSATVPGVLVDDFGRFSPASLRYGEACVVTADARAQALEALAAARDEDRPRARVLQEALHAIPLSLFPFVEAYTATPVLYARRLFSLVAPRGAVVSVESHVHTFGIDGCDYAQGALAISQLSRDGAVSPMLSLALPSARAQWGPHTSTTNYVVPVAPALPTLAAPSLPAPMPMVTVAATVGAVAVVNRYESLSRAAYCALIHPYWHPHTHCWFHRDLDPTPDTVVGVSEDTMLASTPNSTSRSFAAAYSNKRSATDRVPPSAAAAASASVADHPLFARPLFPDLHVLVRTPAHLPLATQHAWLTALGAWYSVALPRNLRARLSLPALPLAPSSLVPALAVVASTPLPTLSPSALVGITVLVANPQVTVLLPLLLRFVDYILDDILGAIDPHDPLFGPHYSAFPTPPPALFALPCGRRLTPYVPANRIPGVAVRIHVHQPLLALPASAWSRSSLALTTTAVSVMTDLSLVPTDTLSAAVTYDDARGAYVTWLPRHVRNFNGVLLVLASHPWYGRPDTAPDTHSPAEGECVDAAASSLALSALVPGVFVNPDNYFLFNNNALLRYEAPHTLLRNTPALNCIDYANTVTGLLAATSLPAQREGSPASDLLPAVPVSCRRGIRTCLFLEVAPAAITTLAAAGLPRALSDSDTDPGPAQPLSPASCIPSSLWPLGLGIAAYANARPAHARLLALLPPPLLIGGARGALALLRVDKLQPMSLDALARGCASVWHGGDIDHRGLVVRMLPDGYVSASGAADATADTFSTDVLALPGCVGEQCPYPSASLRTRSTATSLDAITPTHTTPQPSSPACAPPFPVASSGEVCININVPALTGAITPLLVRVLLPLLAHNLPVDLAPGPIRVSPPRVLLGAGLAAVPHIDGSLCFITAPALLSHARSLAWDATVAAALDAGVEVPLGPPSLSTSCMGSFPHTATTCVTAPDLSPGTVARRGRAITAATPPLPPLPPTSPGADEEASLLYSPPGARLPPGSMPRPDLVTTARSLSHALSQDSSRRGLAHAHAFHARHARSHEPALRLTRTRAGSSAVSVDTDEDLPPADTTSFTSLRSVVSGSLAADRSPLHPQRALSAATEALASPPLAAVAADADTDVMSRAESLDAASVTDSFTSFLSASTFTIASTAATAVGYSGGPAASHPAGSVCSVESGVTAREDAYLLSPPCSTTTSAASALAHRTGMRATATIGAPRPVCLRGCVRRCLCPVLVETAQAAASSIALSLASPFAAHTQWLARRAHALSTSFEDASIFALALPSPCACALFQPDDLIPHRHQWTPPARVAVSVGVIAVDVVAEDLVAEPVVSTSSGAPAPVVGNSLTGDELLAPLLHLSPLRRPRLLLPLTVTGISVAVAGHPIPERPVLDLAPIAWLTVALQMRIARECLLTAVPAVLVDMDHARMSPARSHDSGLVRCPSAAALAALGTEPFLSPYALMRASSTNRSVCAYSGTASTRFTTAACEPCPLRCASLPSSLDAARCRTTCLERLCVWLGAQKNQVATDALAVTVAGVREQVATLLAHGATPSAALPVLLRAPLAEVTAAHVRITVASVCLGPSSQPLLSFASDDQAARTFTHALQRPSILVDPLAACCRVGPAGTVVDASSLDPRPHSYAFFRAHPWAAPGLAEADHPARPPTAISALPLSLPLPFPHPPLSTTAVTGFPGTPAVSVAITDSLGAVLAAPTLLEQQPALPSAPAPMPTYTPYSHSRVWVRTAAPRLVVSVPWLVALAPALFGFLPELTDAHTPALSINAPPSLHTLSPTAGRPAHLATSLHVSLADLRVAVLHAALPAAAPPLLAPHPLPTNAATAGTPLSATVLPPHRLLPLTSPCALTLAVDALTLAVTAAPAGLALDSYASLATARTHADTGLSDVAEQRPDAPTAPMVGANDDGIPPGMTTAFLAALACAPVPTPVPTLPWSSLHTRVRAAVDGLTLAVSRLPALALLALAGTNNTDHTTLSTTTAPLAPSGALWAAAVHPILSPLYLAAAVASYQHTAIVTTPGPVPASLLTLTTRVTHVAAALAAAPLPAPPLPLCAPQHLAFAAAETNALSEQEVRARTTIADTPVGVAAALWSPGSDDALATHAHTLAVLASACQPEDPARPNPFGVEVEVSAPLLQWLLDFAAAAADAVLPHVDAIVAATKAVLPASPSMSVPGVANTHTALSHLTLAAHVAPIGITVADTHHALELAEDTQGFAAPYVAPFTPSPPTTRVSVSPNASPALSATRPARAPSFAHLYSRQRRPVPAHIAPALPRCLATPPPCLPALLPLLRVVLALAPVTVALTRTPYSSLTHELTVPAPAHVPIAGAPMPHALALTLAIPAADDNDTPPPQPLRFTTLAAALLAHAAQFAPALHITQPTDTPASPHAQPTLPSPAVPAVLVLDPSVLSPTQALHVAVDASLSLAVLAHALPSRASPTPSTAAPDALDTTLSSSVPSQLWFPVLEPVAVAFALHAAERHIATIFFPDEDVDSEFSLARAEGCAEDAADADTDAAITAALTVHVSPVTVLVSTSLLPVALRALTFAHALLTSAATTIAASTLAGYIALVPAGAPFLSLALQWIMRARTTSDAPPVPVPVASLFDHFTAARPGSCLPLTHAPTRTLPPLAATSFLLRSWYTRVQLLRAGVGSSQALYCDTTPKSSNAFTTCSARDAPITPMTAHSLLCVFHNKTADTLALTVTPSADAGAARTAVAAPHGGFTPLPDATAALVTLTVSTTRPNAATATTTLSLLRPALVPLRVFAASGASRLLFLSVINDGASVAVTAFAPVYVLNRAHVSLTVAQVDEWATATARGHARSGSSASDNDAATRDSDLDDYPPPLVSTVPAGACTALPLAGAVQSVFFRAIAAVATEPEAVLDVLSLLAPLRSGLDADDSSQPRTPAARPVASLVLGADVLHVSPHLLDVLPMLTDTSSLQSDSTAAMVHSATPSFTSLPGPLVLVVDTPLLFTNALPVSVSVRTHALAATSTPAHHGAPSILVPPRDSCALAAAALGHALSVRVHAAEGDYETLLALSPYANVKTDADAQTQLVINDTATRVPPELLAHQWASFLSLPPLRVANAFSHPVADASGVHQPPSSLLVADASGLQQPTATLTPVAKADAATPATTQPRSEPDALSDARSLPAHLELLASLSPNNAHLLTHPAHPARAPLSDWHLRVPAVLQRALSLPAPRATHFTAAAVDVTVASLMLHPRAAAHAPTHPLVLNLAVAAAGKGVAAQSASDAGTSRNNAPPTYTAAQVSLVLSQPLHTEHACPLLGRNSTTASADAADPAPVFSYALTHRPAALASSLALRRSAATIIDAPLTHALRHLASALTLARDPDTHLPPSATSAAASPLSGLASLISSALGTTDTIVADAAPTHALWAAEYLLDHHAGLPAAAVCAPLGVLDDLAQASHQHAHRLLLYSVKLDTAARRALAQQGRALAHAQPFTRTALPAPALATYACMAAERSPLCFPALTGYDLMLHWQHLHDASVPHSRIDELALSRAMSLADIDIARTHTRTEALRPSGAAATSQSSVPLDACPGVDPATGKCSLNTDRDPLEPPARLVASLSPGHEWPTLLSAASTAVDGGALSTMRWLGHGAAKDAYPDPLPSLSLLPAVLGNPSAYQYAPRLERRLSLQWLRAWHYIDAAEHARTQDWLRRAIPGIAPALADAEGDLLPLATEVNTPATSAVRVPVYMCIFGTGAAPSVDTPVRAHGTSLVLPDAVPVGCDTAHAPTITTDTVPRPLAPLVSLSATAAALWRSVATVPQDSALAMTALCAGAGDPDNVVSGVPTSPLKPYIAVAFAGVQRALTAAFPYLRSCAVDDTRTLPSAPVSVAQLIDASPQALTLLASTTLIARDGAHQGATQGELMHDTVAVPRVCLHTHVDVLLAAEADTSALAHKLRAQPLFTLRNDTDSELLVSRVSSPSSAAPPLCASLDAGTTASAAATAAVAPTSLLEVAAANAGTWSLPQHVSKAMVAPLLATVVSAAPHATHGEDQFSCYYGDQPLLTITVRVDRSASCAYGWSAPFLVPRLHSAAEPVTHATAVTLQPVALLASTDLPDHSALFSPLTLTVCVTRAPHNGPVSISISRAPTNMTSPAPRAPWSLFALNLTPHALMLQQHAEHVREVVLLSTSSLSMHAPQVVLPAQASVPPTPVPLHWTVHPTAWPLLTPARTHTRAPAPTQSAASSPLGFSPLWTAALLPHATPHTTLHSHPAQVAMCDPFAPAAPVRQCAVMHAHTPLSLLAGAPSTSFLPLPALTAPLALAGCTLTLRTVGNAVLLIFAPTQTRVPPLFTQPLPRPLPLSMPLTTEQLRSGDSVSEFASAPSAFHSTPQPLAALTTLVRRHARLHLHMAITALSVLVIHSHALPHPPPPSTAAPAAAPLAGEVLRVRLLGLSLGAALALPVRICAESALAYSGLVMPPLSLFLAGDSPHPTPPLLETLFSLPAYMRALLAPLPASAAALNLCALTLTSPLTPQHVHILALPAASTCNCAAALPAAADTHVFPQRVCLSATPSFLTNVHALPTLALPLSLPPAPPHPHLALVLALGDDWALRTASLSAPSLALHVGTSSVNAFAALADVLLPAALQLLPLLRADVTRLAHAVAQLSIVLAAVRFPSTLTPPAKPALPALVCTSALPAALPRMSIAPIDLALSVSSASTLRLPAPVAAALPALLPSLLSPLVALLLNVNEVALAIPALRIANLAPVSSRATPPLVPALLLLAWLLKGLVLRQALAAVGNLAVLGQPATVARHVTRGFAALLASPAPTPGPVPAAATPSLGHAASYPAPVPSPAFTRVPSSLSRLPAPSSATLGHTPSTHTVATPFPAPTPRALTPTPPPSSWWPSGVGSLLQHTVHGLAAAAEGLTGAVGNALASLSLSDSYAASHGSSAPTRALLHGVVSGVGAAVTAPAEGAVERGVGGLLAGLGRSVMGLTAMPLAGVADALRAVSAQLKEATAINAPAQAPLPYQLSQYGLPLRAISASTHGAVVSPSAQADVCQGEGMSVAACPVLRSGHACDGPAHASACVLEQYLWLLDAILRAYAQPPLPLPATFVARAPLPALLMAPMPPRAPLPRADVLLDTHVFSCSPALLPVFAPRFSAAKAVLATASATDAAAAHASFSIAHSKPPAPSCHVTISLLLGARTLTAMLLPPPCVPQSTPGTTVGPAMCTCAGGSYCSSAQPMAPLKPYVLWRLPWTAVVHLDTRDAIPVQALTREPLPLPLSAGAYSFITEIPAAITLTVRGSGGQERTVVIATGSRERAQKLYASIFEAWNVGKK